MSLFTERQIRKLLGLLEKTAPPGGWTQPQVKLHNVFALRISGHQFAIGPNDGQDSGGLKRNVNAVHGDDWPPKLAKWLEANAGIRPNKRRAELINKRNAEPETAAGPLNENASITESDEELVISEPAPKNGFSCFNKRANEIAAVAANAQPVDNAKPVNVLEDCRFAAIELLCAYRKAEGKLGGRVVRFLRRVEGLNPRGEKESPKQAMESSRIRHREEAKRMLEAADDYFANAVKSVRGVTISLDGVYKAIKEYEQINSIDVSITNSWLDCQRNDAAVAVEVNLPESTVQEAHVRVIDKVAFSLLQNG